MFRASTSSSTKECSAEAGREASRKLKEELMGIKLAFAYASCDYDIEAMLQEINAELPGVPIIGNTSFTGVITPEGFITGEKGFIGMMALADPELAVGVAGQSKNGTARDVGREVAKKAMNEAGKDCAPDYFYMVASPGEEEYYLKGITDIIGRVPFFGGSAADNSIEGKWKIYTSKGVFADGVAVAFFYTDKAFVNQFTGAYRETKDAGIITSIAGDRTLCKIDGVDALKKYADWTGAKADELKGGALLAATITSPLGVKDPLGDLVAIRHPMNGNDDYSMAIGSNLAVNTAVIRMEASVDELINSTGNELTKVKNKLAEVGAYHLVHCGGRRAGIGDRIEEVVKEIKTAAGDTPFIVEFTFGEYGFADDGKNTCGGLMLSFTGFNK